MKIIGIGPGSIWGGGGPLLKHLWMYLTIVPFGSFSSVHIDMGVSRINEPIIHVG